MPVTCLPLTSGTMTTVRPSLRPRATVTSRSVGHAVLGAPQLGLRLGAADELAARCRPGRRRRWVVARVDPPSMR